MTNLKFPLPPALVQAYADTNGFTPVLSTPHFCNDPSCSLPHCPPPAETSAPAGVPPTVNDGQEGGTCSTFDLSELQQVVILGTLTDVSDGLTYPFGTCSDGYFCVDEFGWSIWPDVAGLLRGIEYALTGRCAA